MYNLSKTRQSLHHPKKQVLWSGSAHGHTHNCTSHRWQGGKRVGTSSLALGNCFSCHENHPCSHVEKLQQARMNREILQAVIKTKLPLTSYHWAWFIGGEEKQGIKPVGYRKQPKPHQVSKAFRLIQNTIFQRGKKTPKTKDEWVCTLLLWKWVLHKQDKKIFLANISNEEYSVVVTGSEHTEDENILPARSRCLYTLTSSRQTRPH